MTTLRKNEFMDMLEMNNILFEDKDKFIHCDIPTLGKVTYYPKSDKLQICRKNKWEEGGFEYVKTILKSTKITEYPIENYSSLVKIREVKSDEELRDDFAKNALIGILSNSSYNELICGNNGLPVPEEVVRISYQFADEFMKQRKL